MLRCDRSSGPCDQSTHRAWAGPEPGDSAAERLSGVAEHDGRHRRTEPHRTRSCLSGRRDRVSRRASRSGGDDRRAIAVRVSVDSSARSDPAQSRGVARCRMLQDPVGSRPENVLPRSVPSRGKRRLYVGDGIPPFASSARLRPVRRPIGEWLHPRCGGAVRNSPPGQGVRACASRPHVGAASFFRRPGAFGPGMP